MIHRVRGYTKLTGAWTRIALSGAIVLAAGTAIAQSVPDDDAGDVTTSNLNLPNDPQILGKSDPNVRKATAIVNGDIITETDVDQRLALVVMANSGQIDPAELERIRLQILRNLIDETLEIQEAKANDIKIEDAEVAQSYARVAQRFKQTPAKFAQYLRAHGSSETSMKRQIEGEIAWNQLLGRKVQPFVNVGDDEVNAVIERAKANKGANEYHVGEIFLSATPANAADVRANAERIVQQLRQGGSFAAYARQYSEASTRVVGGDLGWVRAEQLPGALGQQLGQMQPGTFSSPIQLTGGFSIIELTDKRQVLGADPNDAILSLKQITITFKPTDTEQTAAPRLEAFVAAMKTLSGCGTADKVAAGVGGEVVQNDNIRLGDLPGQLKGSMAALQVGQASPPFGSLKDGVRVLVLCGRDDPKSDGELSFDQIYRQMEEERVNLRATRYLRDLRRDAVIDYR